MWAFERPTTSLVARCSAMRTRVLRARRTRACFLFMNSPSKSETLLFADQVTRRSRAKPVDCRRQMPGWPGASLLFRFLDLDVLVGVADALALVGLRRPVRADLGGHLADLLLVRTLDDDLGLLRRLDLHALRHHVHDRMREAERQVDAVAGRLRAEAHANERQPL